MLSLRGGDGEEGERGEGVEGRRFKIVTVYAFPYEMSGIPCLLFPPSGTQAFKQATVAPQTYKSSGSTLTPVLRQWGTMSGSEYVFGDLEF